MQLQGFVHHLFKFRATLAKPALVKREKSSIEHLQVAVSDTTMLSKVLLPATQKARKVLKQLISNIR
jgi:hypothetical protein